MTTRTIAPTLAPILQALELNRPQYVTLSLIDALCAENGVKTPARIVASRLKDKGWLIPTPVRGVWEFAPAEVAGPYSSGDPLEPLKVLLISHADTTALLAGQAAAWAMGLADRVPSRLEVAFAERPSFKIPPGIAASTYRMNLPPRVERGVQVLSPEALVVHMAERPASVQSWHSAAEWLPDVVYEISGDSILEELKGRPASVAARTGYLLQGWRPDAAKAIMDAYPPKDIVWFGARKKAARLDSFWKVADSLLPFDPSKMKEV
ncbi:MAG: hypothetical protein HFJ72_05530 [Adlercreutzia sp.]|nr:hypothetical protein [Adlercreutzia sp.]